MAKYRIIETDLFYSQKRVWLFFWKNVGRSSSLDYARKNIDSEIRRGRRIIHEYPEKLTND